MRDHPDSHGLGVDLSSRMIAVATAKAAAEALPNVRFVHADWERPEVSAAVRRLAARPITSVVCVSALHYFREPQAALSMACECLAPGGQVVLVDRARNLSRLTQLWGVLHECVIRDNVRFYATAQLLEMLGNAGFANVELHRDVRKYFWHGKMYTSLAVLTGNKPTA